MRSSLTCTLGNTEMSPGYPLLIPNPLQLDRAWSIEVPGQFYSVPGEAWLSSAELTATSLPCHEIVMAEFCGASSFLSRIPFGCMRAMTHFNASTLLQLRVKRSVIIECRKNNYAETVESTTIDLKDDKCTVLNSIFYKR